MTDGNMDRLLKESKVSGILIYSENCNSCLTPLIASKALEDDEKIKMYAMDSKTGKKLVKLACIDKVPTVLVHRIGDGFIAYPHDFPFSEKKFVEFLSKIACMGYDEGQTNWLKYVLPGVATFVIPVPANCAGITIPLGDPTTETNRA
ncbi:hypothetical protein DI09_74p130 [Mitosporidium daphniae]|uniref:Thioredoxin domain-containing protein n=1 Tax=Mitosporidium daphniae TaxID=1485682 RepID=A0A098VRR0_9MICR|nr:uncharacterized protein DI09_74p130 [Mitosporidium daphniae]KGG50371.1 hypothetical protein DI09_74p130 [Mitosporidium daphniae]|eukprot:XP_013236798.1 uncharacterized protein DI09_74p130 [Mitosporidium daphniae]